MTASEVKSLVDGLARTGDLPKGITQSTLSEMSDSLAKYFNKISTDKITEFTDRAKDLLQDALNSEQLQHAGQELSTTVGESKATARGGLLDFLEANGAEKIGETMNLDFFLRIPMEVASGAAQQLARNWDQDRVDAYPALELRRVYQRTVPRGSEKDPAGEDNAWDSDGGRWVAACQEAGDEEAQGVFESSGRMVALKSSDVWGELGDGAGGYDDTLGNDFPPFAFNSGMDCDEVPREECITLGLLDEGDEAEGAVLDLRDLFAMNARYSSSQAGLRGLYAGKEKP